MASKDEGSVYTTATEFISFGLKEEVDKVFGINTLKIKSSSVSHGTKALAAWNWAYTVLVGIPDAFTFPEIPLNNLHDFSSSGQNVAASWNCLSKLNTLRVGCGDSSGTRFGQVNLKWCFFASVKIRTFTIVANADSKMKTYNSSKQVSEWIN